MADDPQLNIDFQNIANNIISRFNALEQRLNDLLSAPYSEPPEGVVIVDELIAPGENVTVTDPNDTGFYGAGITGEGRTFGSMVMNVWAVAAGALQVGFNTLGQLVAGAGAVVLDALGITIVAGGSFTDPASYKFSDGTNSFALFQAVANAVQRSAQIYMPGVAGLDNTLSIGVQRPVGKLAEIVLSVDSLVTDIKIVIRKTAAGVSSIILNESRSDVDTEIYGTSATPAIKVDAGTNVVTINGNALSGANTGNETAASIGALINAASAATPNDTDLVATAASAGNLLKITWTNVKAFLKTYFDTIYNPVATSGTWTPTAAFATPGTSSWVHTLQNGAWTHLGGGIYFVVIEVTATPTIGTGTGNLLISTPFTFAEAFRGVAGGSQANWTWPAGTTQIICSGAAGSTTAQINGQGSGIAAAALGAAHMTNAASHVIRMHAVLKATIT